MADRYVYQLKQLLQQERHRYNTFKQNLSLIPQAFQDAAKNQMTLEQLTEKANALEEYEGISKNGVRLTAETYDQLGIIGSEKKTFSGQKVYRAPRYHGKGHSTSWDEIQEELEEAVGEAEKMHAWERERSRQQQGLEEY